MSPEINVKMNLADNGTIKKRNDDAKDLNTTLQKTEKILAGINRPKASGYRGQAMPGGMEGEELTTYGRVRGAVGTGAAARDFANQAQGLGGLVRVYATFAANLFAVGAAFRALSQAADTTNMIKGLDQLGAATGRSLGALSKQLVEVTDGAISMREAMTAVAQSTAAGMTSTNVLRLGTVAKQASQALGVSLPDAINRLSRGITKLEPELLDELGIFVRVDTASQNYARSLGKSASSLTDFEKRQGFANEVLTQAEQKFGKINLVANPYDRLLASTSNLIQKGLELINTVLGPIIDLLSRSPLALTAVLTGIGTLLIRQAIPAIGEYRQALQRASDEALLAVSGKSQAAAKALAQKKAQAFIEAEAVAETFVTARDAATDRLTAVKQGKFAQSKKRVTDILEDPVLDITRKDLDYLYKQYEKNLGRNKELAESYLGVYNTIIDGQEAEKKAIAARKEADEAQANLRRKTTSTAKEDAEFRQRSETALLKQIAATTYAQTTQVGVLKSVATGWREIWAARKGASLDVPIPDTFLKDPRDPKGKAFLLDEQGNKIQATTKVAVEGLGATATAAGLARVALAGTAGAVTSLVSKLGTIGMAVGVAVAVFQVLDAVLSDSAKEMQKLRNAYDLLGGAIGTVDKTLDAIRSKSPDKILSVESIQARANAFNGLQEALVATTKAFDEFGKKQNWWDNWWDRAIEGTQRFLSSVTAGYSEKLFGGGPRKEMAENLSKSIINAIRLAESGPQRDEITRRLSKLVNLDLSKLDQAGLTKALNQLDFSDLGAKSTQISKEITKLSNEANNNASKITSFKTALQDTAKSADSLTASLALTDNFGKIATGLIDSSMKMSEALKDPTNAIVLLKEVIDSTQVLSLLPPDLAAELISSKNAISDLNTELGIARSKTQAARDELAKLAAAGKNTSYQQAAVERAQALETDIEARAKRFADTYTARIASGLFTQGAVYLERSLKNAMQEGGIIAAKGYVSALASLGAATADLDAKLRNAELDLQRQQIKASFEAKEARERNTIAIERNTLQREIDNETQKLQAAIDARDSEKQKAANDKLAELTRSMLINTEKAKILSNPTLANIRGIQNRPLAGLADMGYDKQAAAEMSSFITRIYSKQAQLAKIDGQQSAQNIENLIKKNREVADQKNKQRDIDIKNRNIELDRLGSLESMIGIYDKTTAYKKLAVQLEVADLSALNEQEKLQADIKSLRELGGKYAKGSAEEQSRVNALATLENSYRSSVNKQLQDKLNLITKARIAELDAEEARAKKFREYDAQEKAARDEIAQSVLRVADIELSERQALGVLTDKQVAEERARIDLAKQKLVYDEQMLKIAEKEFDLASKKRRIELIEQQEGKGAAAAVDLQQQYDREKQIVDTQRQSVEAADAATKRGIASTKGLSNEFTQMSKVISGTFDKLADALVEFTETGKLSFKDLIKSMLQDMIRLQLRNQFREFYGNLFGMATGAGSGNWLSKFLGMTSTTGAIPTASNSGMFAGAGSGDVGFAQGAAFDYGVMRFAKGGMFTNSVVSNPTLFKFAQGTGLMGEAGPEAIMPLKRDSSGNLGVRASGTAAPQTTVVVNNYGSEQATTRESTDSNGNRQIEVIIGDVVAQEISRPGSSTQQAMGNTFRARPALTRR